MNTLKEDKAFYKTNLFLATIGFLIAVVLVFVLYRKVKAIKAEVRQLQAKIDKMRSDTEAVHALDDQTVVLKSKAIINCGHLLYIKSDGHYVEYYLDDKPKPEIDRNTMSDVLEQLPERSFVRIHKSFIVNIHRIKIINSTRVMLDNGVWINLSRTYKPMLHDILNKV